jgi:hypothetical protein
MCTVQGSLHFLYSALPWAPQVFNVLNNNVWYSTVRIVQELCNLAGRCSPALSGPNTFDAGHVDKTKDPLKRLQSTPRERLAQ